MSNQGNVVVKVTKNAAGWEVMFTTGRWSGNQTAEVVQSILKMKTRGGSFIVEEAQGFLSELIKNDTISHPIGKIGNADTPTVVVTFDSGPGNIRWMWEHGNKEVLGSWTFEEYRNLVIDQMEWE